MLGHDLQKVFKNEDFIAWDKNELDITNYGQVQEKFFTIMPDLVINATGYTQVDLAETEEEKANQINGAGVAYIAGRCREIGATIVHFSTDYVFNGSKKKGYNEEDPTNPINAYGRSKVLGEKHLVDWMESLCDENPMDGQYFLIRTSWLFGQHGKNFVDTMLELGKKQIALGKKGQPLKVVNDQFGKPTFTMDLAQQVKWLVETNEYPYGIYHITNEGTTTWYDFAKEIFKLAKMKVDVLPCSSGEYVRPAKRPSYSILNNTKLPPLRSWKEALKEYLNNKL